jgi:hypothetical protein
MFTKPKRSVDRVFIHCSASDAYRLEGDILVNEVRRWHVDQNGWADIGYHFLIDKKGKIMAGRPLEKTPSAQFKHNTGTIAIMVHGLKDFSEESLAALKSLCIEINSIYSGEITFHGHCEVSYKACPVFDYKSLLNLDSLGKLGV